MPAEFASLKLKNPFMAASGCFGYGWESAGTFGEPTLGAVVTKTVTPEPVEGNPPPRIFETESGIVNRIGLQNCGVREFIERHLPRLSSLSLPYIISIYSFSRKGWGPLAGRVSETGAAALELNLSCPNLKGKRFTLDSEGCALALEAVKQATNLPLLAKINAYDAPVELSCALAEAGADAVVCSNTLPAAVIKNGVYFEGGLSGPAIKPVVLKAVKAITSELRIPVAACGGISSLEDVREYSQAGAKAFQLGSALLKNPRAAEKILRQSREDKQNG